MSEARRRRLGKDARAEEGVLRDQSSSAQSTNSKSSVPKHRVSYAARVFSRYRSTPGWTPNPISAAILLVLVRVSGALANAIADCDETYNYWEPLHWLLHRSGLQTWEYSPQFALRSYAFLFPYAGTARVGSVMSHFMNIGDVPAKLVEFYSVRVCQAIVCAVAELSVYDACVFRFGKSAGRLFLAFTVASPGMYRAASELLPSSFAMIMFMLGCSNWMMGRFAAAVAFVAIAAMLGWPFAALLGLPIALHVWYRRGINFLLKVALACGASLLALMVPIDSHFYGKVVVAPLNIVLYNVFPKQGSGPEIFGVEPLSFYVVNLALNALIPSVLVLSSPVLSTIDLLVTPVCKEPSKVGQFRMSRIIFLSPVYLWLLVFFTQAHKEERFLAPAYPLLCLVGAVTLDDWCSLFDGPGGPVLSSERQSRTRPVSGIRFLSTTGAVVVAFVVGASRVAMQLHGFAAPMKVFRDLSSIELRDGVGPRAASADFLSESKDVNVCIGSEWYRFPSHFFLPERRFRLRFVRAGFQGLLPKPFEETPLGSRVTPRGMNMFNKEDPSQYISSPAKDCHYFIEIDAKAGSRASMAGYNQSLSSFYLPRSSRLTVLSEELLDLEASAVGYRSFWIPQAESAELQYRTLSLVRNLELLPLQT